MRTLPALILGFTALFLVSCENPSQLLNELKVDVVRTRDGELSADFTVQVYNNGEWMDMAVGTPSHQFRFHDTSAGKPTSWFWEFSDGTTSAQQNPLKTFEVGSYDVTLTISRLDGTSEITDIGAVVVAETPILSVDWEDSDRMVYDGENPYFRDLEGLSFSIASDTELAGVYLTEAQSPSSSSGYTPPENWSEGLLWREVGISMENDGVYTFEIDVPTDISGHPGDGVYCDGNDGEKDLTIVVRETGTGLVSWASFRAYQDRTAPVGNQHTIWAHYWYDNVFSGNEEDYREGTDCIHFVAGSWENPSAETTVTLEGLGFNDNADISGIKSEYSMNIWNDESETDTWVAVSDSQSHELPFTAGIRTVNVQYRDAVGNVSTTVSDTIEAYYPIFIYVDSLTVALDGDDDVWYEKRPGEISWTITCWAIDSAWAYPCRRETTDPVTCYSGTTYDHDDLEELSTNGRTTHIIFSPPNYDIIRIAPVLYDYDGNDTWQNSDWVVYEHKFIDLNGELVTYDIEGEPGGSVEIRTMVFCNY